MNSAPMWSRPSTIIAARVKLLGVRLVSSATATYGKIGQGFLDARIILQLRRRPHVTAARLSELLGVDSAAISRAVKSLKDRSLVVEARPPLRSLSLTEQGWALEREVEAISDEREARLLRGFDEDEADRVLDYLQRMLDNMSDVAALADEVLELIGPAPAAAPAE